jgi:hypothetical protein
MSYYGTYILLYSIALCTEDNVVDDLYVQCGGFVNKFEIQSGTSMSGLIFVYSVFLTLHQSGPNFLTVPHIGMG